MFDDQPRPRAGAFLCVRRANSELERRLERAKGFEPSTPTLARQQVGSSKLLFWILSCLGADLLPRFFPGQRQNSCLTISDTSTEGMRTDLAKRGPCDPIARFTKIGTDHGRQCEYHRASPSFHSLSPFPIVMPMVIPTPTTLDRRNSRRFARFAHLAFWRPALRVLCYHRVLPARPGRFTVTTDQLDAQLHYLSRSGFHFIHARDLLSDKPLPKRPLLLTFDDGYVDNLEHAQPVLRKHSAKATIFIVTAYAGDRARWDENGAALMSPQQLHELDPEVIELALHSHSHRALEAVPLDEIEVDIRKNLEFFRKYGLTVTPALAYPYGSRPKRSLPALSNRLASLGIPLAFRLGSRLNRLPITSPYEIQRIDVRGDASDAVFRRKLWIGKLT